MLVLIIILSLSVFTNLEVHSEYLLGFVGENIHSLINNSLVSSSRKERADLKTTSSLYVIDKFDIIITIIIVYFSGSFTNKSSFFEYIVFIVPFIIFIESSKFNETLVTLYSFS